MVAPRIVIIGAGPAGISAALRLIRAGITPIVIDEAAQSGGQIYRRPPHNFNRTSETLYGAQAGQARVLHEAFDHARAQMGYRPNTTVYAVERGRLFVESEGVKDTVTYDRLIVATGATDRIAPLPGWVLPGVYTLGGAQIALKAQGCVIGKNPLFFGSGPLLYLTAFQYLRAGVSPAAVLDTAEFQDGLRGLWGMSARPRVLAQGIRYMLALRRAKVPVMRGIIPLRVVTRKGHDLAGLSFRDRRGVVRECTCDAIGMGYHLRPESQLADLLGCNFYFDRGLRQWLPESDGQGRSSVQGVYLAGDGARILGADGAEIAGALAAATVLSDIAVETNPRERDRLRSKLARHRRFARGIVRAFPWPTRVFDDLPEDTIVCRCEGITLSELNAAVQQNGADDVNRIKAFCRIGMGRCQGRYCGLASQELTARALGVDIKQVGRVRGQAPIKPLSIGSTAAKPK